MILTYHSKDNATEELSEEELQQQLQSQKRPLELMARLLPRRRTTEKAFVIVDFSPDDSEQAKRIDRHLLQLRHERRYPNLQECSHICRAYGVRGRVTFLGDYVGHIFEDGKPDHKVIDTAL